VVEALTAVEVADFLEEDLQTLRVLKVSGLDDRLDVAKVGAVDGLAGAVENVGCRLASTERRGVFNVVKPGKLGLEQLSAYKGRTLMMSCAISGQCF
jgi:hypothetical protein